MSTPGHRNIKPDALPLKRGMLHYAYSRKMPVQVVITAGKENVLSEKAMSTGFGQVLVTGFSDVIDPNNFKVWASQSECARALAASVAGQVEVRYICMQHACSEWLKGCLCTGWRGLHHQGERGVHVRVGAGLRPCQEA